MVRDLDALLPLPAVPYDPSDRHLTRASSLSLVRYRTNDYSVPAAYGHREVLVRGYVDEVVISCGTDVIARHRRSYERDDFVFDPIHYLLRLSELELIDRHHRMVERRIKAARFPTVKSLDTFDFLAIPSVNRQLVTQLARCEYVDRRENIIAIGNSGTGKTHMALGLGLAACQRGLSVGFTTAAALVNELMEARDDRRLLNFQKRLSRLKLLIIDELGFVPLSKTGAELLFEVFSQRYERGSVLVTTNLPFDEWTDVFDPRD